MNLLFIRKSFFSRAMAIVMAVLFTLSGVGPGFSGIAYAAQGDPFMPAPAQLVPMSSAYNPVTLKGIKFYPNEPFKMEFILDEGNTAFTDNQLKEETNRLIRYFLCALTVPAQDMWVNLSPYESDRIIADDLGFTEIGRDMLAQDYMLKQLSASLTYPENDLGKQYWKTLNGVGANNHSPVNSFNKIWIMPDKSEVYESGTKAVITESSLKIMTEADYLAMNKNGVGANDYSPATQAFKTQIIPEITKDVNTGKNFARLRQLHSAIVLAAWFKTRLKDSLYDQLYVNKKKTGGLILEDKTLKDKIYNQYVEAFKKGVYNYIKKEPVSSGVMGHKISRRQYFSGGIVEPMTVDAVPSTDRTLAAKLTGRRRGSNVVILLAAVATAGGVTYMAGARPAGADELARPKTTESAERAANVVSAVNIAGNVAKARTFSGTLEEVLAAIDAAAKKGFFKKDPSFAYVVRNEARDLARGLAGAGKKGKITVTVGPAGIGGAFPRADVPWLAPAQPGKSTPHKGNGATGKSEELKVVPGAIGHFDKGIDGEDLITWHFYNSDALRNFLKGVNVPPEVNGWNFIEMTENGSEYIISGREPHSPLYKSVTVPKKSTPKDKGSGTKPDIGTSTTFIAPPVVWGASYKLGTDGLYHDASGAIVINMQDWDEDIAQQAEALYETTYMAEYTKLSAAQDAANAKKKSSGAVLDDAALAAQRAKIIAKARAAAHNKLTAKEEDGGLGLSLKDAMLYSARYEDRTVIQVPNHLIQLNVAAFHAALAMGDLGGARKSLSSMQPGPLRDHLYGQLALHEIANGTPLGNALMSLGTAATGVLGMGLQDHRDYELEANIPGAIYDFARELSGLEGMALKTVKRTIHGQPDIDVWDFKGFLNARGITSFRTEKGWVYIDEATGFLVLQVRGMKGGHIGRGSYNDGITIYAGTDGQAAHEIREAQRLIDFVVETKKLPRDYVEKNLGDILDEMLNGGDTEVWGKVINIKWEAHKDGLGAQAAKERWSEEKLAKELARADKQKTADFSELATRRMPQMRTKLDQAIAKLGSLRGSMPDSARDGRLPAAVRQEREATISSLVRQIDEIMGLLRVWEEDPNQQASLATATGTDDNDKGGPGNKTSGGISEEGLTVKMQGDGTRIPMFKGAPLDVNGFTGFDFKISKLNRNQTSEQLVMASAI